MLERSLESRIMAAVAALEVDGLAVGGTWQPKSVGGVMGEEDNSPAAVMVRVSPRSYDRFGICEASLDCAISLAVRADVDPTGEMLSNVAGKIASILHSWNMAASYADLAALSVEGEFDCGGVQINGGDGPIFEDGAWTVTWSFTVRGTVPEQIINN